jgi:hypothetical protein
MVNKERVALLVEALQSGRFQQGHRFLESQGEDGVRKHCCLGVACAIAEENGLLLTRLEAAGTFPPATVYFRIDGESGYLPPQVQEWFGFDHHNPLLAIPNYPWANSPKAATNCNDILKLSFAEIADAFQHTFLEDSDGE